MSVSRVELKQKHVHAIRRGHPWVYRQALVGRARNLKAGAEVIVTDEKHRPLARGIIDPGASAVVRVWTTDPDEPIDQTLIERRLGEALALRELSGVADEATAYRLVNAEGDRMPGIVVERMGDWLAVTLQTHALKRFEKMLITALEKAVPAKGIVWLDEKRARLASGEAPPAELWVREPTGRFLIDLNTPGKPGLFMDMRQVRQALAPRFAGKRFLNLFAHTGAFSGAAAAAGASEIVDVDLSPNYLAVSEVNVAANREDAAEHHEYGELRHETIAGDVFESLRRLGSDGRLFDVVLCDPPTFSSSRQSGAFSVKDSYRPLVRASLRVLEPGGLLVCATNWRGISRTEFLHLLHDAGHAEQRDLRVMSVYGPPADYPVVPAFPDGDHLNVAMASAL